jgi:hypothetical protein
MDLVGPVRGRGIRGYDFHSDSRKLEKQEGKRRYYDIAIWQSNDNFDEYAISV